MLRPRLNAFVLAIGAFFALTTWFTAPAKAVVIIEASVDGGAFQTIATAPTDQFVPLAGLLPNGSGSVIGGLEIFGDYPVLQASTIFASTIDSLTIRATATDLDTPAQVERLLTGYSDSEPDGGLANILVEAFIDPNNAAFGTTIPVAGGGPLNNPVTAAVLTQLSTPVSPLYSLTTVTSLTNITGPGNFNTTLQVVPEPGTLGLLGAGLMVAGLMLKRRRRQA